MVRALSASETRRALLALGCPDSFHGFVRAHDAILNQLPEASNARRAAAERFFEAFSEKSILLVIGERNVFASLGGGDAFREFCVDLGVADNPLEVAGFKFARNEVGEARRLFVLCVTALWDVLVIGPKGRPWVWYSHDEVGNASFRWPDRTSRNA